MLDRIANLWSGHDPPVHSRIQRMTLDRKDELPRENQAGSGQTGQRGGDNGVVARHVGMDDIEALASNDAAQLVGGRKVQRVSKPECVIEIERAAGTPATSTR